MGELIIDDMMRRLLGLKVCGVRRALAGHLMLNMGAAIPDRTYRSGVRGEWCLLVMDSAWLIGRGSELLAASEDGPSRVSRGLGQMEGATVAAVAVLPPALDATFRFSGDLLLRVFPRHVNEHEHWNLYAPEGMVLVAGPGSRWRLVGENEP